MRVAALEGHRVWAAVYDDFPNPLLALEMRVVAESLGTLTNCLLIDIGCGTGRWMAYAGSLGASVVGIDFCNEMLLRASAKPRLAGRVALASAERLPLPDNLADVVLCSFAIGYFADPRLAIGEMARVAAPGAVIAISEVHPEALAVGWKRGFRLEDSVYEIEHAPDAIPTVLEAADESRLQLQAVHESCFGEPERDIFRRAGKEHSFAETSRIPAVWAGVWRNP